mmetsp:Transcript_13940/g.27865  ORF Transcript_13940/g.27865 Transcript_13940/m.27865 type:complete len:91 (-) Transcript_13940:3472-3744(-)
MSFSAVPAVMMFVPSFCPVRKQQGGARDSSFLHVEGKREEKRENFKVRSQETEKSLGYQSAREEGFLSAMVTHIACGLPAIDQERKQRRG